MAELPDLPGEPHHNFLSLEPPEKDLWAEGDHQDLSAAVV